MGGFGQRDIFHFLLICMSHKSIFSLFSFKNVRSVGPGSRLRDPGRLSGSWRCSPASGTLCPANRLSQEPKGLFSDTDAVLVVRPTPCQQGTPARSCQLARPLETEWGEGALQGSRSQGAEAGGRERKRVPAAALDWLRGGESVREAGRRPGRASLGTPWRGAQLLQHPDRSRGGCAWRRECLPPPPIQFSPRRSYSPNSSTGAG